MRVTPNVYGEWLKDGGQRVRDLFQELTPGPDGAKKKLRRTTLNMLIKQLT